MKNLVSVIITTYNRQNQLKQVLTSVVNQTYKEIEIIVVDNYSDYDFYSFLESFQDSRIRGYQNQNHGIISVNRNYAMNCAKGSFLAFCDDDDVWEVNKLEECMNYSDQYDMIFHDSIMSNGKYRKSYLPSKNKMISDIMAHGNPFAYSSVVLRKKISDIVGRFSEESDYVSVEDWDYWMRVIKVTNKIKHIKRPLMNYYVGTGNTSRSLQRINNEKRIYNKYIKEVRGIKVFFAYLTLQYRIARVYHLNGMYIKAFLMYFMNLLNIVNPRILANCMGGMLLCVFRRTR